MSGLIPFQFDGHEVRVVALNGSPAVVAKDVAEALDYEWNGAARIAHVPEEWKGVTSVVTPRGSQEMAVLTEQGLYFFLGRSDKPKALPFQKWIAGDVLPSIRKTGTYVSVAARPPSALEPVKEFKALFGIAKLIGMDKNAAAISANQAVTKLTGTNLLGLLGQTHLEQPEQAQFFTPTELGEQLKLSGRKVNMLLAEAGFQFKRGDVWEVMEAGLEFAKIYDTGKKHGSGVPICQIKWSPAVLPLLKQSEPV
jgi:prophage antirepressor-like protein